MKWFTFKNPKQIFKSSKNRKLLYSIRFDLKNLSSSINQNLEMVCYILVKLMEGHARLVVSTKCFCTSHHISHF
jgi:hypothetical protein